MKRKAIAGMAAAIAALTLAGCGTDDSIRDLETANVQDPQAVTLWNNIDGHPNIARVCTDGVGWATTMRDYGDALTRVPEWDAFCKTVGSTHSKNSN